MSANDLKSASLSISDVSNRSRFVSQKGSVEEADLSSSSAEYGAISKSVEVGLNRWHIWLTVLLR